MPLQIKVAAGDQLEAIRCGRVAVEDGRRLGGDAAGRSVGRSAGREQRGRDGRTSRDGTLEVRNGTASLLV